MENENKIISAVNSLIGARDDFSAKIEILNRQVVAREKQIALIQEEIRDIKEFKMEIMAKVNDIDEVINSLKGTFKLSTVKKNENK